MADTRGTFRLKNVRQDILNNEYVSIPSVFIANDKFGHGHFFDGQLRRYNISNSVSTMAGPTYFVSYDDTGGGSQEHTYWSGGGSNTSTIRKLVYSTYTTTASLPSKVLTPARNQMASVSKNTDVYYTGGAYPSVGNISTTQKLTFSNDNIALVPGSPYSPGVNASMSSFNNGGTYGYFWGGVYNPSDTKVIRLTFSNDTMAALPGTTNNSGTKYFGMWNMGNTTNGYHVGGGIWQSDTNKITYANETFVRIPGANYPDNRGKATSFTAGADTGLVSSGRSSSGPGYHSDTNLLTFSTDSWAAAPGMNNAAPSPGTSWDYGTGTGTSARDSKIGGAPSYTEDGSNRWFDSTSTGSNGVDFDGSGDYLYQTVSDPYALRNWWDQAWTVEYWIKADAFGQSANGGSNVVGVTNHSTTGESWSFGPKNDGEVLWYYYSDSTVRKMESGKTLSTGQWYHLAFVFDGSTSMKIFVDGTLEHSEEVIGTPTGGSTTFAIGRITASGNDFNGRISNLRIAHTAVYSNNFTIPNETLTNITGTKLLCCQSSSSNTAAAVTPTAFTASGDPTAFSDTTVTINQPPTATPTASSTPQSPAPITPTAFFMAGRTPDGGGTEYSSCGKIQFASETRSALPGSNIPARRFVAGASSTLAGYCFGGSNTIAKLLYSTDAASTLPSTLPAGYKYKAAVSNDTIAYCFGGAPGDYSIIDKLTFSNDTVSANTPSNRPDHIRYFAGQLSSPTKGYFATGGSGPNPASPKCHYIQFSNDSGSSAPDAPSGREAVGSCSNATVGYITGGRAPGSPGFHSNTMKFTFSNETWSNVPGAPLAAKTYALGGTSNQTFAYFSGGSTGGYGPSVKATTRKFTFASETMGSGTSLDVPRWGFGYTANTESNHPQTQPQPNIPHVI